MSLHDNEDKPGEGAPQERTSIDELLRPQPSLEDRIRQRAHELWHNRNLHGHDGDADSDWHQAEREIRLHEQAEANNL